MVRRGSSVDWAMPKSVSFTRPLDSTMMFDGFTSRCTTPAACAVRSADSSCSASLATASCGSGPRCSTRSVSVVAWISSMTMNVVPWSRTTSYTVTTPGSFSRPAARASRSTRSSYTSRSAGATPSGRCSSLMATCLPMVRSSASQTMPMPPRPISRSRAYRFAITR